MSSIVLYLKDSIDLYAAGGNTGIGKEIVRALLRHNAKVYLASRSAGKAKEAIDELKADTGKEALFLQLDLASLKSVRKAAEEFLSKEQRLDTLFNNGFVLHSHGSRSSLTVTTVALCF